MESHILSFPSFSWRRCQAWDTASSCWITESWATALAQGPDRGALAFGRSWRVLLWWLLYWEEVSISRAWNQYLKHSWWKHGWMNDTSGWVIASLTSWTMPYTSSKTLQGTFNIDVEKVLTCKEGRCNLCWFERTQQGVFLDRPVEVETFTNTSREVRARYLHIHQICVIYFIWLGTVGGKKWHNGTFGLK